MHLTAGEHVTVRGARWIVDDMTTFGDCAVLCLSAAEPFAGSPSCRLLLPFDRPVRSTGQARVRAVTPREWLGHLHCTLSELRSFGQLRAAVTATIDILPFQLEPAIALAAGRASRFLIADEVGLGKTVQAGLMLAELRQRGWCDRALILTPAGLRRQWADELERRFQIRTAVIDAAALRVLTSSLPVGVNPWAVEPVVISSIDFVKQPEVLRGFQRQLWDLLIIDEAHQASAPSLRCDAAQAIAGCSRHVVLLTATPHGGDEAAYRSLCNLGRVEDADPVVLFRRTRRQVGLERMRRVHLLSIRLTPEEMEMHRLLAAYVARLWDVGRRDVQLVAMVLSKRAFSSASSLTASLERRLGIISGSSLPSLQARLPFDPDTDEADEPPEPVAAALDNSVEEEEILRKALHAARLARAGERKVQALLRLLRRVREPIIVFTEYRDTLDSLQSAIGDSRKTATLHGGKTPQERRGAVDAFTSGAADLLLATDAGSEGLNLHACCRLVVNLELPWNPIRLEQRIGRVDRIGQGRTVHAINLFAQGTAESSVLANLLRRLDRISASEIEVAATIVGRAELPARSDIAGREGYTEAADVGAAARSEASRINAMRFTIQTASRVSENQIAVTLVRSAALRSPVLRSLGRKVIWFIRMRLANRAGRLVEDALVPIATALPGDLEARGVRTIAEQLILNHGRTVIEFASQLARERSASAQCASADWALRGLARERILRERASLGVRSLIQPGLFDNRAERLRDLATQDIHSSSEASVGRSNLLEASAIVIAQEPQIALLLMSC